MATKADIVSICEEAVAQRRAGNRTWEHNGQTFDLVTGGWCDRFVRQVYETADHQPAHAWRFDSPTARITETMMKAAHIQTSHPEPGDIISLDHQSYEAGHIAIVVPPVNGVPSVAENTSGWRGNPYAPGTKITPLSLVIGELSGYYAPIQSVPAQPEVVFMPPGGGEGVVIDCKPKWVGQHIAVLGVPVLTAMGLPITNQAIHADTGYAFVKELQASVPEGWSFTYRDMVQGPRIYIKHEAEAGVKEDYYRDLKGGVDL